MTPINMYIARMNTNKNYTLLRAAWCVLRIAAVVTCNVVFCVRGSCVLCVLYLAFFCFELGCAHALSFAFAFVFRLRLSYVMEASSAAWPSSLACNCTTLNFCAALPNHTKNATGEGRGRGGERERCLLCCYQHYALAQHFFVHIFGHKWACTEKEGGGGGAGGRGDKRGAVLLNAL